MVGGEIVKSALSSVADLDSAGYRLSWLVWLQQLNEAGYLQFPWVDGGKIEDAVCSAFAIVPMTGMPPPRRRDGFPFPFDLDELIRLIKENPEASDPMV